MERRVTHFKTRHLLTDELGPQWEKREIVMYDVWSPTLLLVGVPGCVLALLVLGRLWQRVPIYLFFLALAVADLGILLFGLLPDWLKRHDIHIVNTSAAMCSGIKWINYTTGMLSAFFLTGAAVFRALSLARPIQMRNVQPRTVQGIIATMTVVTSAFNLYVPYYREIVNGKCDWSKSFVTNYQNTISWINAIFYSGLPFLIMTVANAIILNAIYRIKSPRMSTAERIRQKVTLVVVVTSFAFIILSLPLTILRVIRGAYPTLQEKPYYSFLFNVTLLLWYTISAINFYLYICTGNDLRYKTLELISTLPCCSNMTQDRRQIERTSMSGAAKCERTSLDSLPEESPGQAEIVPAVETSQPISIASDTV